jgi:hypothetical protein
VKSGPNTFSFRNVSEPAYATFAVPEGLPAVDEDELHPAAASAAHAIPAKTRALASVMNRTIATVSCAEQQMFTPEEASANLQVAVLR